MEIIAEIFIQAPRQAVWQVFAGLEDWDAWNPVCSGCRFVTGDAMAADTCFEFVIKPFVFPVTVSPRIVKCDSGREVVWEGRRWGLHAVHSFFFRDAGGGTRLRSVEVFSGPLVPLRRVIPFDKRLHRLTERLLQAVKDRAEGCAGSG